MAYDSIMKGLSAIGLASALIIGSNALSGYRSQIQNGGGREKAIRKEDKVREPISMKQLDDLSVAVRKELDQKCMNRTEFSSFIDNALDGAYGESSIFVATFRVKDRGGIVDYRGARDDYVCRLSKIPSGSQAADIGKYTAYVELLKEHYKGFNGMKGMSLHQVYNSGYDYLYQFTDIAAYLDGDEDRMYETMEHASRDALSQLRRHN